MKADKIAGEDAAYKKTPGLALWVPKCRVKNKRILITGGAGFIGKHLWGSLCGENDVRVYDSATEGGGDIRSATRLKAEVADKIDIVIHCAAVAGIYSVDADPFATLDINLGGTLSLVKLCQIYRPELVVNFSSSEVYGLFAYDAKESDQTSQGAVHEGRWVYGVSKLAAEYAVALSGINYVSVRPFNIYGPGQKGEGAIHDFVKMALRNVDLTIHGAGSQVRSWCYITDFIDAMMEILGTKRAWNRIYNIGNPHATITVKGLAEKIIEATGSSSSLVYTKYDGPEVKVRVPNIDLARKALMFDPKVSIDEGIKKTVAYYRKWL